VIVLNTFSRTGTGLDIASMYPGAIGFDLRYLRRGWFVKLSTGAVFSNFRPT
jgi:hypothetical protein